LDLGTILKTTGCKENQIKDLGYKVEGGYVEFGIQQQRVAKGTQEILLKKMGNLVAVADQMNTFE
jgi:hypothetical protein